MKDVTEHPAAVDVVRQLYSLFGQGRLEETFELMSDDVELFEPGDADVVPWAGRFHGHDGLREFYRALGDTLSEIDISDDSLEIVKVGDRRVLALGTERGVVSRTGRSYVTHSAWLWEVEDGRIARLSAFHDTAAMVDALRERPRPDILPAK